MPGSNVVMSADMIKKITHREVQLRHDPYNQVVGSGDMLGGATIGECVWMFDKTIQQRAMKFYTRSLEGPVKT